MSLRIRTALVACLAVASLIDFVGANANDWTDIENPSELRHLFSNKTFRKHHVFHGKAEGWIAHFREDGKGIYKAVLPKEDNTSVIGTPRPRKWEIKGVDQVCISSPDTSAVNCYRFQRNRKNPNELKMTNVVTYYVESIAVEDGVPNF